MYKKSEVEKVANEYFGDSLAANVWVDKYALKSGDDEYHELSPDDTLIRLAKEIARIELKYENPLSYNEIYELLKGYHKFVLGGSAMFGIGNNLTLSTLGNCFVVDSPLDSYGGIFKTDQELAQLMKRRGGVGVDISTIRGRGTKVNNAANSSTGIVPFMERYSNTTREVAQEGRRGALMISMDVRHPDIVSFITAKDDLTKITGANISVRVSDDFMASEDPKDREIWKKIIHQAWKNAEPGILFWDKIVNGSPADCYADVGFKTISTNPCSELPLCAYDSCRLSAINLYAYVEDPFTDTPYFNFSRFIVDVAKAQRIMDDIVDLEEEKIAAILKKIEKDPEPYFVKSVEISLWDKIYRKLLDGRRTGLGLMGLADAGAALGFKYGSDKFNTFSYMVLIEMSMASYRESVKMAKERGAFPVYDFNKERNHPYLNNVIQDTDFLKDYLKYGRRNIANLTIAPTGSISILAGVSSGIEPVYALTYNRKRKVTNENPNRSYQDKNGDWWEEYKVSHPAYETWRLQSKGAEVSPYEESTAHKINPLDKLKLQAVIQRWIDHSISVTYNLPANTTEEQVSDLYLEAWRLGLKGMTVYRDGSREGILTTAPKFRQSDAPKRPKVLPCDVYSMMSKGKHWIVCVGLLDSKPYEVFAFNEYDLKGNYYVGELIKIARGKYNLSIRDVAIVEDITKNCSDEENLLTRMISTSLRHGADMKFVVEQLLKSEGDITSFGKAIARTLKRYVKDGTLQGSACPSCGTIMVSEGGCWVCKQCGSNKCE